MPIIYRAFIRRQDLKDNPDCLFVFGDNFARVGLGGQAKEMRGEKNAVGIVTKLKPSMTPDSFFTDVHIEFFRSLLLPPYKRLRTHLDKGGIVVCPNAGVGTDRAALPDKAPRCFAMLKTAFTSLDIRPPEWEHAP